MELVITIPWPEVESLLTFKCGHRNYGESVRYHVADRDCINISVTSGYVGTIIAASCCHLRPHSWIPTSKGYNE